MNYELIENKNILKKITFENVCKVQQGLQIEIKERLKKQEHNSYLYITIQYLKNKENPEYILNPRKTVICNKNDILVARTGSTGKIVKGVEGVFHNNFFKLNLKDGYSSDFLYYVLTSFEIQEKIKILTGVTTIPDLNHGDFYSLELYPFSLAEQINIASILSKQDSIISNIQQLIEKNEIIFNELSEKLLSGELRLQENSGKISLYKNPKDNWKEVEVNGEIKSIPKDWNFEKFSQNINFTMGNTPKKENDNYNGNLPWVTISNFTSKYISEYTAKIKKLKNVKILPKGTLLGSFKMSVGKFAFTIEDCATNEAIIAIKENDTVHSLDFLYHILPKYFIENAEQNGQGLLLLNSKKINNIDILLPPFFEQKLVANFLKKQEQKIENLTSLLKNEKEKFEWLLDNLLSGNYLVKEMEQ